MNRFLPVVLFAVHAAAVSVPDTLPVLPALQVVGARTGDGIGSSARTITIIDRADLDHSPAATVGELLEQIVGVDVRRRGSGGVQTDVHFRGGTFEETLVLIDGVRISDPQTGHHDFNLPLPLQMVERIEVLHGHAARVHGPDAAGGVVNIVTRTVEQTGGEVHVTVGQHGVVGGSAGLYCVQGRLSQRVSVARERSDGFRPGTQYTVDKGAWQGRYATGSFEQVVFAGYRDNAFGADHFYTTSDEWEQVRTLQLHTRGRVRAGKGVLSHQVRWRYNRDTWIYSVSNPAIPPNEHATHVLGGDIGYRLPWVLGETALNLAGERGSIESSNLGSHARSDGGVGIEHSLELRDVLTVRPGVLLHYYPHGEGVQGFPGLDLELRLRDSLRLYATSGRSFRLPSFTEYYFDHPRVRGDSTLLPARGTALEGGVDYRAAPLYLRVNGYINSGRTIDWLTDSATGVRSALRRPVRTRGVEGVAQYRLPRPEAGFGLHALSMGGTIINTRLDPVPGAVSYYLDDPLRYQCQALVRGGYGDAAGLTLRGKYEQRAGRDPVYLADMRVDLRFGPAVVYASMENLFDFHYEDVPGARMPGRTVRSGASVTFRK